MCIRDRFSWSTYFIIRFCSLTNNTSFYTFYLLITLLNYIWFLLWWLFRLSHYYNIYAIGSLIIFHSSWLTIISVSYTHLDVYKRQTLETLLWSTGISLSSQNDFQPSQSIPDFQSSSCSVVWQATFMVCLLNGLSPAFRLPIRNWVLGYVLGHTISTSYCYVICN